MDAQTFHVVIGGEAGQGLVTLGELLIRILVKSGYHIFATQNYMSRIRGGHNTFSIRIGIDPIEAPQTTIDMLVALDDATLHIHEAEMTPRVGVIIIDDATTAQTACCIPVPFKKLADAHHRNIAALGVTAAFLGLAKSRVSEAVVAHFNSKDTTDTETNRAAVDAAYVWADTASRPIPKLTPTRASAQRLVLNGNEALALGALAGGVKFCAFYPMSPATSIMVNLAQHAEEMGLIVEQAEDEIAAINMVIGASFSGSRSMTATSGGGFALMTEGISLSAMTETPVVIVVAQRPGPATGLPTRTEQSDLEFVLHAGHGEFPRAIFAPGSIEACFTHMFQTFALAEASQGPVFLLTDQFLADAYRDVHPFELGDASAPLFPQQESATPPYQRYAFTTSGVSPRCLPGISPNIVTADSDEHDERGHITEDLKVRSKMVEKRLQKMKILLDNVVAPAYDGETNPDILLISWGSTKGAVDESASRMRAKGKTIGTLHFSQVWPLVPTQFLDQLHRARHVVCIEGNATGQFSRLIRRETGFSIDSLITRYDGLPFTPEYILEGLAHV